MMKLPFNSNCLAALAALALTGLNLSAWGAVPLAPSSVEAWVNQGKEAYRQAKYDEALSDYQKALDLDDRNFFALYAQGLALVKMEKWKAAALAFRKAVETGPDNPKAWLALGWAEEKTGKEADAIESYQKVLQLDCAPQDRILAAKHLSLLGAPPAASATSPAANPGPAAESKNPFNWLSLNLEAGIVHDSNLNSATDIPNLFTMTALQDRYTDLAASLGVFSGPKENPRARGTAFYQFKSFSNSTDFNIQNLMGKAAFETPFLRSFRAEAGLGGQTENQAQGTNYSSGFGWIGLKFMGGPTRVMAAYTYTEEIFTNYPVSPNVTPSYEFQMIPNDSNHQLDVSISERLLPGVALSGRYRFKDNQAIGPLCQYLGNGIGGGAEFFIFYRDNLITGIQFNYLASSRQYLGEDPGLHLKQSDAVNLFTVQCNCVLFPGLMTNFYYRLETDDSNIKTFSYSDQVAGLSLSYDLL